uniref:Uncharacterized protein n=1 Tax=uncultured organism MedDCM-OCT-S08-C288 TaxID=743637 RepID=D6PJ87_9ZZZZ|nr:hypothetical protein [uncultured organism MedDCM-OCT-S08-C288]
MFRDILELAVCIHFAQIGRGDNLGACNRGEEDVRGRFNSIDGIETAELHTRIL